jgi:Uma2 family endonuclease
MPVAAVPVITEEDWERLEVPEGYRAEVIRGELVVTPSGPVSHGGLVVAVARVLAGAAPAGMVALAGTEWLLLDRGRVAAAPVPDLTVVNKTDVEPDQTLRLPPVLTVEVLSRSDRRRLERSELRRIEGKRLDFAAHGVRHHLEVALVDDEVEVLRYELRGDALEMVDRAIADEWLHASVPFAYDVQPSALYWR